MLLVIIYNSYHQLLAMFLWFVLRVAKAPETNEPDLVEDLGQKKEGFACVSVLRYPSAGKVGINLSIASLRLWPP